MKILYYDCFSGISGDMNLGAMVDLGVESGYLLNELSKLGIEGWEIEFTKEQRHGITGTKATVRQTKHEHVHRHLSDISKIINNSMLDREVKELAIKIFDIIAQAEAHVHNTSVEKIHFHEVGAIDAIIDITGAAICYNYLKPDAVVVSPVELGGGFVKCAHGTLPVPAPATAEIVKNLPVTYNGVGFEATTPTGAAILAAIVTPDKALSNLILRPEKTAYGVGQKENPSRPNLLRVFMAEADKKADEGHNAVMIECNIDDMNPELYEHVTEKLFTEGASDVYLTNVIMKKGRPGIILSVICEKGVEQKISELLFTETTTIGLRTTGFRKSTLVREFISVSTELGDIGYKLSYLNSKLVSAKPEYDDCKRIANEKNIPLKEVQSMAAGLYQVH